MNTRIPIFSLVIATAAMLGMRIHATPPSHSPAPPSRPASPESITVTDLAGRTVSIAQPVNRIVLLRGRDLYELGLLGDDIVRHVVAWGSDIQSADREAYNRFVGRYPELGKTVMIGSVLDGQLSPEQIVSLKPDLVIADVYMRRSQSAPLNQLERAGLPLLFLDLSGDPLTTTPQSLILLGTVLGKEPRAREIAGYVNARITNVLARLPALPPHTPSLYIEAGNRGTAVYGNTYGTGTGAPRLSWGALLAHLPCRNTAAGMTAAMAPINPESLLQADPDVIVITGAHWPSQSDSMRLGFSTPRAEAMDRLRAFTQRPGWAHLQAVKTHRVHALFHGFGMHMTAFVALEQLAQWMYPREYADLDPDASLRDFGNRFMPIPFAGTWMISLDATP